MPINAKACLAALAVSLVGTSTAFAQAPDPRGCTPQERSGQPLGQKLDQSNGVICPPDVDPAMKTPTPKSGDPSVIIPPPGSPGGDPNVQPK
jgi:hypothetical protein